MSTPDYLLQLVDDAAIFPPGNLPLDRAVAEHREHTASAYAGLVGGFVVSDVKLPDLIEVVGADGPLGINLVVTGGAGAIEPAVRWATRSEALTLNALELTLRDEADLAHNARRVIAALDALAEELEDVEVYVEPTRLDLDHGGQPGHGWVQALDELAARELRLKFRTGGVSADAFPSEDSLATCIGAALDRELPFKCTAGLHNAVRHLDESSFERPVAFHGFLNVLLATRAALDGEDAAAVLTVSDPGEVAGRLADLGPDALTRTRRWFTSFGSCSVLEPHDDLVELGLLEAT